MVRLLCVIVAALGIASLVFGIIFVAMGSSAKTEILDEIAAEGWPTLDINENAYPYLTLTAEGIAGTQIIDTVDEVEDTADVVEACRAKITGQPAGATGFGLLFTASTFPQEDVTTWNTAYGPPFTADTIQLHEYCALLSLGNLMGAAKMGFNMTALMQYIGIVNILIGVALIVTAIVGALAVRRPS